MYEAVDSGMNGSMNRFAVVGYTLMDTHYVFNCHSSSYLFGCSGLRNKKYCILNKQYSKEEYEELLPRIIEQMSTLPYVDTRGITYRYGEFFPSEISPFAYNETIAFEHAPLIKDEVLELGFRWRDAVHKDYKPTCEPEGLPDSISETPDTITKEVISCAHQADCNHGCSSAYRILPEELAFYRELNVPLPRLCPNCRYRERFAMRNPHKLWHRQCMKEGCSNEFETSYAPDRPETVYCEQCYQQEVA